MELKNKVVVITGGTKGFGLELAKLFVAEGSKVVVCGKEEVDLGEIKSVKCNVADEDQVKNFVENTSKDFGSIDIFINNAGIWLPHNPFQEAETARFEKLLQVNVVGTFLGSKYATIKMQKQGAGTIINVISTSALEGRTNSALYCATKFAVNGFTKSIRNELSDKNIKVLSIFPGGMKTSIFDEGRPDNFDDFMDPHEVAQKVIGNLKEENPVEELIIKR